VTASGPVSGSSVPGPAVQPAGLTAAESIASIAWDKMRNTFSLDNPGLRIVAALDAAGLLASSPQPPDDLHARIEALTKGLRKVVKNDETEWIDANIVRLLLSEFDQPGDTNGD
jgi:hypothetical protein